MSPEEPFLDHFQTKKFPQRIQARQRNKIRIAELSASRMATDTAGEELNDLQVSLPHIFKASTNTILRVLRAYCRNGQ